jgi:hypothetical protein
LRDKVLSDESICGHFTVYATLGALLKNRQDYYYNIYIYIHMYTYMFYFVLFLCVYYLF